LNKHSLTVWLLPLILVVAFWETARIFARTSTFPDLYSVIIEVLELFSLGSFYESLLATLGLAIVGLLLGLLASYFIALVIVQSTFLDNSSRFTLNFLRSIPVVVLMPLTIVALGPTIEAVVLLTTFSITSKLVVFAVDGLRSVTKGLNQLAKLSSFSWWDQFVYIQLPTSARYIIFGLQLSTSRAYGTVILCGLLMGSPGLGFGLKAATDNANYTQLFAYGFILAVLGVMLYWIIDKIEDKAQKIWGLAR
jgi:ABC-type nitrate/sulfonate/bicarbonate transport system permease component